MRFNGNLFAFVELEFTHLFHVIHTLSLAKEILVYPGGDPYTYSSAERQSPWPPRYTRSS